MNNRSGDEPARAPDVPDVNRYVLERYSKRAACYWQASRHNKRAYKVMRYLTVILGALVTLLSSLSSADFVQGSLEVGFAVLTPHLDSPGTRC